MPTLSLVEPAGRYLSFVDREDIAVMRAQGHSMRAIAHRVGRSPSTISRELARNFPSPQHHQARYRASTANSRAEARARRPKPTKLELHPLLWAQVEARLMVKNSPRQISRRLVLDFPNDPEMRVSPETIYRTIYVQGRGELRRDLAKYLRTGRALRKPRRPAGARAEQRIKDKVMISERPPEVADRAVPGHWEGDLICGTLNKTAIGTLVERHTRFVMLLHLPKDHGAEAVAAAIVAAMGTLPAQLRRSLTWDQGIELARHASITIDADLPIYFCDPHSPWQRGSNENTNGLLRQYFPKGTSLAKYTAEDLAFAAAELNARPRETLGFRTPAEALAALLSTDQQAGVATAP
jgi:IS30 family transposase